MQAIIAADRQYSPWRYPHDVIEVMIMEWHKWNLFESTLDMAHPSFTCRVRHEP